MAALFLLMTVLIASIFLNYRIVGMILLLFVIWMGCWGMLWYHATDVLKINW